MKKPKLRSSKPMSREMPTFRLSWREAAHILKLLAWERKEDLPLTPEEASARDTLADMFQKALDETVSPDDMIPRPVRCACGHVFLGRNVQHPPTKEEWIAHINFGCKIPSCPIPL